MKKNGKLGSFHELPELKFPEDTFRKTKSNKLLNKELQIKNITHYAKFQS